VGALLAIALVGAAGVVAFALARPPSGAPAPVPDAFAGLERLALQVGDHMLDVVVAADHARGLMGIDDLGPIDGMLFEYPAQVEASAHRFWMQGVRIPLDIAFFGADGVLVSQVSMPLCPEADQAARRCPLHGAAGPFRWALETEAGTVRFAPGARLVLPG
jgi:uncharacterized membrane protein (UPF0127 family)